jgi:hypothetical protein
MKVSEAINELKGHYYLEQDEKFLYVREGINANGIPVRLTITWLDTVSDRMVKLLLKKKGVHL